MLLSRPTQKQTNFTVGFLLTSSSPSRYRSPFVSEQAVDNGQPVLSQPFSWRPQPHRLWAGFSSPCFSNKQCDDYAFHCIYPAVSGSCGLNFRRHALLADRKFGLVFYGQHEFSAAVLHFGRSFPRRTHSHWGRTSQTIIQPPKLGMHVVCSRYRHWHYVLRRLGTDEPRHHPATKLRT